MQQRLLVAHTLTVGVTSFATGFVAARTSLFDEVRRNPEAVAKRLERSGQHDLAEWVRDNFIN